VTKLPRDLAEDLDDLLSRAFAEDGEDVTSLAVFGPAARLSARIVCRERAVIAGAAFLPRLFAFLSPPAHVTVRVADGTPVTQGTALAEIEGPAITVLAAERTALNLVQRLSGIATKTRQYVDALEGTKTVLLDTRKTTAGLRRLERYAVRCGGGTNHRYGLAWGFLVKDNHADGVGSVWEATRRAKDFRALNKRLAGLLLETEARSRDEVHQALDAGAERILLDNMTPAAIAEAVSDVALFNEATGADVTTEASGRMTPHTARAAAEAGVDFVSAGAITHSATAIDIALEVDASHPRTRRRAAPAPTALARLLKKNSPKVKSAPKPSRHTARLARKRRTRLLGNPKPP
jgi:nicotinate-nucleotide pyrophosphorylase (carboxylating)